MGSKLSRPCRVLPPTKPCYLTGSSSLSAPDEIDAEWRTYIEDQRRAEVEEIIKSERLHSAETLDSVHKAFRGGSLQTTRTAVTETLPPGSPFAVVGAFGEKKQRVLTRLGGLFQRSPASAMEVSDEPRPVLLAAIQGRA